MAALMLTQMGQHYRLSCLYDFKRERKNSEGILKYERGC